LQAQAWTIEEMLMEEEAAITFGAKHAAHAEACDGN
jgi:hypothetical protein